MTAGYSDRSRGSETDGGSEGNSGQVKAESDRPFVPKLTENRRKSPRAIQTASGGSRPDGRSENRREKQAFQMPANIMKVATLGHGSRRNRSNE
jgi:hypothetical protein